MNKIATPSEKLYAALRAQGLNFFTAVPCKLLDEIVTILGKDTEVIYTPVTREEEGVGILAGAFLAGKKPVMVMQNSGLGNCINAVCSLLNYSRIPVTFIISHRGTEGEMIDAQRPMGEATKALLAAAHVDYHEVGDLDGLPVVKDAIDKAYAEQRSVAFLFPFSFWKA